MVNVGDSTVPTGQSKSLNPLTSPAPTKPLTAFWPGRVPAAGASPNGPFFQLPGSLATVQPSYVPSSNPAKRSPAGSASSATVLSDVKVVPSKSPTKYWPPEPPATLPGLRLTTSTHLVFAGSPSTASGKRSGHSQMPPVALAGPKSLRCVHVLRSSLRESTTWYCRASTAAMTQYDSPVSGFVYRKTFGSRKFDDPRS